MVFQVSLPVTFDSGQRDLSGARDLRFHEAAEPRLLVWVFAAGRAQLARHSDLDRLNNGRWHPLILR